MPSTRSKAKSITDTNCDSNKSLRISGVTKPTTNKSSTKSPPKSTKAVPKVSPEAKSYVAAVKGGKSTGKNASTVGDLPLHDSEDGFNTSDPMDDDGFEVVVSKKTKRSLRKTQAAKRAPPKSVVKGPSVQKIQAKMSSPKSQDLHDGSSDDGSDDDGDKKPPAKKGSSDKKTQAKKAPSKTIKRSSVKKTQTKMSPSKSQDMSDGSDDNDDKKLPAKKGSSQDKKAPSKSVKRSSVKNIQDKMFPSQSQDMSDQFSDGYDDNNNKILSVKKGSSVRKSQAKKAPPKSVRKSSVKKTQTKMMPRVMENV